MKESSMQVVVAVPWRDAPGRGKWLEVVKRHYATHFPEWPLIFVDAGGDSFSRAKSRNLAVAQAEKMGAAVVVINDADVLAKSSSLRAAVEGARAGGLHLPFEACTVLTGSDADKFAANVVFPRSGGFPSTGGIYAVRPDQWRALGGVDENFIGWGGEDDQTVAAATALVGVHRHPGVAVSLGHSAERLANPRYAENMVRTRAYEAVADDPQAMRALIAGRDNLLKHVRELPPRVAVIAPSRGRPENIERLWRSIQDTALLRVDLLVGLDEDDAGKYPRLDGVQYVVKPRQRLNAWWNELALANLDRYDTFVFAGDDNVMVTPGWDFLLDDELARHNYIGFATGPDGLRTDKKFTWAAIGARQIEALGYVGPPGLIHLCIDTAWQYLANATGTMYWLDHVLIEHLHYSRKGAAVAEDQTYREANSVEVNRQDHETVNAWGVSVEFKAAVKKLQALLDTPRERSGAPSQDPDAESAGAAAGAAAGAELPLGFEVWVAGALVRSGSIRVPVRAEVVDGHLQLLPGAGLAELVKAAL
ncbi:galactosyltransferase-related protein [Xanthomonas translucens pv. translucens]|uniref:galactosyltransferase-related protein n=1 Tax=Xanthomonas campestris pv. translucens TaxID=343 RepID=UPI003F6FDF71